MLVFYSNQTTVALVLYLFETKRVQLQFFDPKLNKQYFTVGQCLMPYWNLSLTK